MVRINCDIGERGAGHPVDMELMTYIHIANIACGGHAGDAETVEVFTALAEKNRIQAAAHLSYPDRENFGRTSMAISQADLIESLDSQLRLMPDVAIVKFHGALYNDSVGDSALAAALVKWLEKKRIEAILTFHDSALANEARFRGIEVIGEVFAERRYEVDPVSRKLKLMDRKKAKAVIHDCDEAVRQTMTMIRYGFVEAEDCEIPIKMPVTCDTVCIHSDSVIALDLARRLHELTGGKSGVYA